MNFQDPPTKRIKLSSDNLLSNETLNATVVNTGHNATHANSPHNINISQRSSNQFHAVAGAHTPTLTATEASNTTAKTKINSSNNLLAAGNAPVECESPTLICGNARLSTGDRRLNNMSNNNLSTSASLLDATTDDAMSSNMKNVLQLF